MARQRKAFTKEERKVMIVQAFLIAAEKGIIELTTADISHALQVTSSTKLRDMLTEMVIEDYLNERREKHASIKGYRRLFSLARAVTVHNGKILPKHEGRTIVINSRKNGQQVLFKEFIS